MGIDVSGSVDADALSRFAAELPDLVAAVNPESVHVVTCDAAVRSVTEYGRGESVELGTLNGGGGTDYAPVLAYAAERDAVGVVYFTDLEYPLWHRPGSAQPAYPVLWVCSNGRYNAPWGTVVRVGG